MRVKPFYHGTRADLKPGDLIESRNPLNVNTMDMSGHP
jgi:hypothetical protein